MYVRWQPRKRRRTQFGRWGEEDRAWSAVIVENARVKGTPTQRHIAYLVGFTESAIKIMAQRCHLWDRVSARLDELGDRITADDRKRIEAAVADKVPRPTVAEYKAQARDSAQTLGWRWLTKQQKAALRGEAKRWKDKEGRLAASLKGRARQLKGQKG